MPVRPSRASGGVSSVNGRGSSEVCWLGDGVRREVLGDELTPRESLAGVFAAGVFAAGVFAADVFALAVFVP